MLIANQLVGFGQKGSTPTPSIISLSGYNLNAFVEAGSPIKVNTLTYTISLDEIIGSLSESKPALHFPDSFALGTTINLLFYGRVQAAGGTGGNGGMYSSAYIYAGGGGGAGYRPGPGGTGGEAGADGTATAGGEGGEYVSGSGHSVYGAGAPGGIALLVERPITITQLGPAEIWGGGGGGGGRIYSLHDGGDGGGPGEAGEDASSSGGAAGIAIDGVSFVTKVGTFDIQGAEIN